jgi:hypothetical protein
MRRDAIEKSWKLPSPQRLAMAPAPHKGVHVPKHAWGDTKAKLTQDFGPEARFQLAAQTATTAEANLLEEETQAHFSYNDSPRESYR